VKVRVVVCEERVVRKCRCAESESAVEGDTGVKKGPRDEAAGEGGEKSDEWKRKSWCVFLEIAVISVGRRLRDGKRLRWWRYEERRMLRFAIYSCSDAMSSSMRVSGAVQDGVC
jgi:hypothetical protein